MDKFVNKKPRLSRLEGMSSSEKEIDGSQPGTSATETGISRSSNSDEKGNVVISTVTTVSVSTSDDHERLDIGNYIESFSRTISDSLRYDLLSQPFTPSLNYDFKADVEKGKRPFLFEWLHQYEWLAYSKKLNGPLCKFCVLFRPAKKRGVFGGFVIKPCLKYRDFHTEAKNHIKSQWHKDSMTAAKNFESIITNKRVNVVEQLNTVEHLTIESNRKKLVPIISTLIFCGTHDLALRGHTADRGNFPDLLKFRVESGDSLLEDHLKTCSNNAKYTSHMIQNELVNICGDILRRQIVKEANITCFSLLADETADISGIEQLSIGIRFIDKDYIVREEFLGFTPLEKFKAEDIAGTILSTCSKYNLDMEKMIGLGFDGCSTMAGRENGVQKLIRDKYPKAKFFHCSSHRLNLVVNDLNTIPEIRNSVGVIKEIIKFFRESPARRKLVTNIPLLCETRWSEKFKSIRIFSENFIYTKNVLEDLMTNTQANQATRTSAHQLFCATNSAKFLVCLNIIAKYSSQLEPITNILQTKSINLDEVQSHITKLINIFKSNRSEENVNNVFHEIFESTKKMADEFGLELSIPRLASRQTQRSNVAASTPEDYYRISLFVPYLDSLITSLEIRFPERNVASYSLCCLHPARIKRLSISEFSKKVEAIQLVYHIENLGNECQSWYHYWTNETTKVEVTDELCFTELLSKHCTFFPAIAEALKILISLPPTTCTIERSFSTLRRVKTWLRSTMSADRLDGLCLLSVHREKVFNVKHQLINEVIDEFGKERRRLKFVFSDKN